jgi:hypothetical protein
MRYTATADTILKKEPIQGSRLPDDQKVNVTEGKTFGIKQVIETDGVHSHVELESGAGSWWIFLPHWDTGATKPVITPSTNGIVTAVFTLKQASSSKLILGSLTFFEDGKEKLKVVASSGQPRFQKAGDHTVKGLGCLPPATDWKISTNGYNIPANKQAGVAGMFYHITPDPRLGRSELGLHRDANFLTSPGSAGCIVVIDSDTFNDKVVPLINGLKNKQAQINLSVVYT